MSTPYHGVPPGYAHGKPGAQLGKPSASAFGGHATLGSKVLGYWKEDESSGAREDSHTNGYDLTDNNTVTGATGIISGAAAHVKGNNEYLSLASRVWTDDLKNGFCVWGWIYPTDKNAGAWGSNFCFDINHAWNANTPAASIAMVSYASEDRVYFIFRSADGTSNVDANSSAQTTSAFSTAIKDKWTFVCLKYENGEANEMRGFYGIDGGSLTECSGHTTNTMAGDPGNDASQPLYIGGTSQGASIGSWDGRTDEFGISTLLTDDEISDLYNSGSGLTY